MESCITQISSVRMYVLVVPSLSAMFCFILNIHATPLRAGKSIVLLGSVCLAPQLIHLVAFDTSKIWTYSLICAFVALWLYAEIFTARRDWSPSIMLFCLTALIVNIIGSTPLMDGEIEHFSLKTRLLLYSPVMVTALFLVFQQKCGLIKKSIPV